MNSPVLETNQSNILIVDDNPANLRLLIDILGREGYQVRPVPSGKLALAAARGLPPDLILLDIMMPDLDGYQVCRELKADPSTRDIPVIFVSAINEVIDKVKAFQVGAVDYITKPFQIEEVLARVDTHLKICSLQKNLARQAEHLTDAIQELERTRDQLIHSEKMAALGQLIAGIAHEINTPMGAIRSSVENLTVFFEENLVRLPTFFQDISIEERDYITRLIENYAAVPQNYSTREKRQFKRAIIGELETLGVEKAEAIADTLVDLGVYDRERLEPFIPLVTRESAEKIIDTAYQLTTLQTSAKTIKIAAEKATKIVFALRNYTRYEQKGEPLLSNLVEGIETVLTLYHNQLKQGVEINREYRDTPNILCYPDELNQVWTNLISNALQAMKNKGVLTLGVERLDREIQVTIADNGAGIPLEIQSRVFDPFFTTKPVGEGTGLGLDIARKIVEKHRGKMTLDSIPGRTTFTVSLPIDSGEARINQ
ncbi:response regulator [Pannus brasiliensis CCIBt3594]|uniref:histidine kinase n=1 Tax=Pannus brasiliensis CCIBt3594 TaxID=1427578 RepID=A0AAW9QGD8_9CHRO